MQEATRLKSNSFVKTQSLDLKTSVSNLAGESKPEINSENQILSLELSSTVQFEAGPEYESMVSRMLDPSQSEQNNRETFLRRSMKQADLGQNNDQNQILRENPSEEYYLENGEMQMNPESEYGNVNCMDIREYLRPYARDSDHLSQMLIEQKMGRFDIMDKISEEQSVDLDNSFMTNGMNKSMVFGRETKLLHSDSWWLGPKNGREIGGNNC